MRDRGRRAAVTGGKQLDGFVDLVKWALVENGLEAVASSVGANEPLPGYFRANKAWDLVAFDGERLVCAVEFKSHRGPSFGNNFNNRTEEALGSAVDAAAARREASFPQGSRPFLGWLMLLEDHPKSRASVKVENGRIAARPEFAGLSYADRYGLLAERLVAEGLYHRVAVLLSEETTGAAGHYSEPAQERGIRQFLAGLVGHVAAEREAHGAG